MQRISGAIVVLLFKWQLLILYSIGVCKGGGELSAESEYFFNFIRALDPENTLRIDWNHHYHHHHHHHPCSNPNQFKGVECDLAHTAIRGIRLENKNLGGRIDADSLCKLPELRVLSLARNRIKGSIPESILNCKGLIYLDLSSNLLSGRVPLALNKLKDLRKFDISDNYIKDDQSAAPSPHPTGEKNPVKDSNSSGFKEWTKWLPLVFGVASFFLFISFVNARPDEMGKAKENPRPSLSSQSPAKVSPEMEGERGLSELVFFVEEEERFGLEDLLDGEAELLSHGIYSSLYKVKLCNDDSAVFAVKRLMKLQVSSEEFGETMKKIGNLRHPNIRPLVGYNTSDEEKLLIYGYQRNGSLLTLQENYAEGNREFPWKLRLSIAVGIARGLEFIYQSSDDHEREIIPHGNIKPSNILLSDQNDEEPEPLISEYGYSKFQTSFLLNFHGYTAPERSLSEQADVYSFGVILLELLTGKMVEKSGLDLPKWVKSMVREEWTGEVFDKGLDTDGMYAFPLLNIALKCVAHFPENRPSIAEVVEKIEEIVNAREDLSPSSPPTSMELS